MLKVARKALIKVTHNKELKVLRSGIISVHLWFSYKCCKKVNSYQNACIVSVCGIPRPTLHSFGMSRASDSRGRSENWARLRGTFISFQYFPVTGSTLWPFCTTSHRIGSQTPGKKVLSTFINSFLNKKTNDQLWHEDASQKWIVQNNLRLIFHQNTWSAGVWLYAQCISTWETLSSNRNVEIKSTVIFFSRRRLRVNECCVKKQITLIET